MQKPHNSFCHINPVEEYFSAGFSTANHAKHFGAQKAKCSQSGETRLSRAKLLSRKTQIRNDLLQKKEAVEMDVFAQRYWCT